MRKKVFFVILHSEDYLFVQLNDIIKTSCQALKVKQNSISQHLGAY